MNNIKELYSNIKENNNGKVDEKVRLLFAVLEMEEFQEMTQGRFTSLFIFKLIHLMIRDDAVIRIIQEIRKLESIDNSPSKMKSETQFVKGKIKGLYHKHYMPTGLNAIIKNIESQISFNEEVYKKKFNKILCRKNLNDNERIDALAKLTITEQLSNRLNENHMTGEWIIFHKFQGENYYLDIGNHIHDEIQVADQIRKFTLYEFPELAGTAPIFE